MDDLMFGVEEKRPFPDTDYKNGQVKPVRGRMLKKLMKYELKSLFSGLWITLAILAGMTVLICILLSVNSGKISDKVDIFDLFGVFFLFALLYLYSLLAGIVVPIVIAGSRYYNNFFKDEGYLTFSIPATAEEHILAKHLSGMIATAIGAVCSILSVIIVSLVAGGFERGTADVALKGFSGVMYDIEQVLIGIVGFVTLFCVMGAMSCFAQKFDKRKHVILRFVLIYVIIMVVSTLVSAIGGMELTLFFATEAGLHLGSVLTLLGLSLLAVFCFWYERRTLKYKLNLK